MCIYNLHHHIHVTFAHQPVMITDKVSDSGSESTPDPLSSGDNEAADDMESDDHNNNLKSNDEETPYNHDGLMNNVLQIQKTQRVTPKRIQILD